MENKIRVFISYSNEDKDYVKNLIDILEKENDKLMILWTKKILTGADYIKEIKLFIEHAHIFLPVITKSSSKRGWVHQEIGYALSFHIPIFQILIDDTNPIGMIESLQAIRLQKSDGLLNEKLNYDVLSTFLKKHETKSALYLRAFEVENRARLMAKYSEKIFSMDKYGVVRQKGGLSSFHIPNKFIEHQDWVDRYLPNTKSPNHKKLQLAERKALQQHAEREGCKLIVNPNYAIEGRDPIAAIIRVKTMIEFLESMPDDKVVIAFQKQDVNFESLTMVGDWFLAESVSFKNKDGFTNTFFTRNASEITKRMECFDEELAELLKSLGWTPENSRVKAIEELNKKLTLLK